METNNYCHVITMEDYDAATTPEAKRVIAKGFDDCRNGTLELNVEFVKKAAAEKHRADVAEEALKEACIESIAYDNRIDNKNYVKLKRRAMYDRLIKQAEARLKEQK